MQLASDKGLDHLDGAVRLRTWLNNPAVLGARRQLGGEPGRIVVTEAPDPEPRVVIGLTINDRGLPERWTGRITITHDRSSDERRRWAQHLHRAVTERRDWTLTVIPRGPPNPHSPCASPAFPETSEPG